MQLVRTQHSSILAWTDVGAGGQMESKPAVIMLASASASTHTPEDGIRSEKETKARWVREKG